jgi:G6PDH family F420-dependent oxidoreductase
VVGLGAIGATTRLSVTTRVTCPTFRTHPAIVAHGAATSSNLLGNGRFWLGAGSGEALNDHILGDRWRPAEVRPERLAEAIELMRCLSTRKSITHRRGTSASMTRGSTPGPMGKFPVLVSAFGEAALGVATEHGDGWVTTSPHEELLRPFRQEGRGAACGAFKVCYGDDEATARRLAFELWPTSGIPGQLHQDLSAPTHFEHAASCHRRGGHGRHTLRPRSRALRGDVPRVHGPRLRRGRPHAHRPDVEGFLGFYEKELRPRLGL